MPIVNTNDGVEVAERAKEEVKEPASLEAKGRRGLKSDWTNILSIPFFEAPWPGRRGHVLRPNENTAYWNLERWMREILELKFK